MHGTDREFILGHFHGRVVCLKGAPAVLGQCIAHQAKHSGGAIRVNGGTGVHWPVPYHISYYYAVASHTNGVKYWKCC